VLYSKRREIGTVNYIMNDAYTGEISKFEIKTASNIDSLFFKPEDVLETTDTTIKLKVAVDQS
jgi:hypothetical protein